MSKHLETWWQTEIAKAVRRNDGYARKVRLANQKGFPDLYVVDAHLALHNAWLIEVKLLGFKRLEHMLSDHLGRKVPLTPIQWTEIKEIRKCGGFVEVLVILEAEDAKVDEARMGLIELPARHETPMVATARNTSRFIRWGQLKRYQNTISNLVQTKER